MWSLLIVAAIAAPPAETPGEIHLAAFVDLSRLPVADHPYTRYLSLHAVPPAGRTAYFSAITFALNSVSWRSTLYVPVRIGPALIRLNLEGMGWDVESRSSRIERLRLQGIDVANFRADCWEEFARLDPYFFTSSVDSYGASFRGWTDPAADYALRLATGASKAVVRADWLLSKLLIDDVAGNKGGLYSQALLLPATENDLFKVFGIDLKFVESDPQLKSGGAVLESIVALHNRELQLFPSLYGHDERFIWRSLDVNDDKAGDKSVIDSLIGTLKRDGSEYIGTLPNGLHWYWVGNAVGKQVAVVPQGVAIDQRQTPERIKDRSVINAYKCMSCHGQTSGIFPFTDVIGPAILSPAIALASKRKDGKQAVEDYYLGGLADKLSRQNESYVARVKACNGLASGDNSSAVVERIESYLYDVVTPEQAARDMGRELDAARILWRSSGSNQNLFLSAGQSIKRGAWERSYRDAQQADHYPWDTVK